jgi:hypothetical protein
MANLNEDTAAIPTVIAVCHVQMEMELFVFFLEYFVFPM